MFYNSSIIMIIIIIFYFENVAICSIIGIFDYSFQKANAPKVNYSCLVHDGELTNINPVKCVKCN